jgi:hypothetical protein
MGYTEKEIADGIINLQLKLAQDSKISDDSRRAIRDQFCSEIDACITAGKSYDSVQILKKLIFTQIISRALKNF